MKFKIKQNILMNHLNYSIRGVSNKNLIPILNCIKFELKEEGLYLSSTDNEISIKTFIPSNKIENVDSLGEIVVSGRFIYDIIKKLPGEIVDLEEVMDSKLYITTNKSSFTLNCNEINDFPDLKFNESDNVVLLNNKTIRNIINETIFATSNQESRPALTGLNIKVKENILECTATDSFRLAKKVVTLTEKINEDVNIIIPTRSLNELIKMIDDNEENIELHIFENKVLFKCENITMMSSLINGTYPDTSKLIPTEFETVLEVNLNDYYNAIDRASLLTNESDKNTIMFESNKKDLLISSNIPEIGNVKENITVENNKGKDISIAFSSVYMMDALKTFDSENIELCFNGDIKPIILKNKDDDSLIQLIVPIRTY